MNRTRTHSSRLILSAVVVLGVAGAVLTGTAIDASATSRVVATGDADVRVWIDDTRDVYGSYNDVVISLYARRDCYATVFVVDTDGYVHVVRPLSPRERAWVRGGYTYRYTGFELGLERLAGRGIVHVFAVSSPNPFDYSPYGEAIFAGRFGYRVYGDPFIACREITVSLLPAGCSLNRVSVSFARFYIREWTRYPGYLCAGHAGVGPHVRVGDYCRHCSAIYDTYRLHVADPYVVIQPRSDFRRRANHYAEVKRSTVKFKARRDEAVAGWSRSGGRDTAAPRVVGRKDASRVVSHKRSTGVRPARDVVKSGDRKTTERRVKGVDQRVKTRSKDRGSSSRKTRATRDRVKSRKAR